MWQIHFMVFVVFSEVLRTTQAIFCHQGETIEACIRRNRHVAGQLHLQRVGPHLPSYTAKYHSHQKYHGLFIRPFMHPSGDLSNQLKPNAFSMPDQMSGNTNIYANNVFINYAGDTSLSTPLSGVFGKPSQLAWHTRPLSFTTLLGKPYSPLLKLLLMLLPGQQMPRYDQSKTSGEFGDSSAVTIRPTLENKHGIKDHVTNQPLTDVAANNVTWEAGRFSELKAEISNETGEVFSPLLRIDEYFSTHENRTDECLLPSNQLRRHFRPSPLCAKYKRFYIDFETRMCKPDTSSGCGMDSDGFQTLQECLLKCSQHLKAGNDTNGINIATESSQIYQHQPSTTNMTPLAGTVMEHVIKNSETGHLKDNISNQLNANATAYETQIHHGDGSV